MSMAKIIVIANGKGGTGKSTLCIHLANYLTSIGKAVAVDDILDKAFKSARLTHVPKVIRHLVREDFIPRTQRSHDCARILPVKKFLSAFIRPSDLIP